MKKRGIGDNSFLILGILILTGLYFLPSNISGSVVQGDKNIDTSSGVFKIPQNYVRLIVPADQKDSVLSKKCMILHELTADDQTDTIEVKELAVACPKGVFIPGALSDNILTVADSTSNAQIHADGLQYLGYTGKGVTIALVDTGVDYKHPELQDSIVGGMGFGYPDFDDEYNHGTMTAGVITSNGDALDSIGVAPDAKIWVARVCDPYGRCYESDVSAAIEYIVRGPDKEPETGDEPAKIISMSLQYWPKYGFKDGHCNKEHLARKINWAAKKGVIPVVAAGNYPFTIMVPGCAKEAVSVGAVYSTWNPDYETRAYYSGIGKALDIMAPTNVLTTSAGGGYYVGEGTSMATPHVAGVIALLQEAEPKLKEENGKLIDALYKTAKDLGDEGFDSYYGNGRIDAYAALKKLKKDKTKGKITDCNDGKDNDGDGFIDYPKDPGCIIPEDTSEFGTVECDDGIDNADADNLIDYPKDPGCFSPRERTENDGECDDTVDNDGDTFIDYPKDPECTNGNSSEKNCMDSDGKDIQTKGTVSGTYGGVPFSDTDFCNSMILLNEYLCDYSTGKSWSQLVDCSNMSSNLTKCQDGACVP